MPWIRFDPNGGPAPSSSITTLAGEPFAVADFYGRANLALFFGHGLGCAACRGLIQCLAAQRTELCGLDAEALVCLPSHASAPDGDLAGVHLAADPDGGLRRRYADLIEFDAVTEVMLFVLDRFGVPYAGWTGREADAPDLCRETMKWLEYIAIQCPE